MGAGGSCLLMARLRLFPLVIAKAHLASTVCRRSLVDMAPSGESRTAVVGLGSVLCSVCGLAMREAFHLASARSLISSLVMMIACV